MRCLLYYQHLSSLPASRRTCGDGNSSLSVDALESDRYKSSSPQAFSHAAFRQLVHHRAEHVLDIVLLRVEHGLHIVAQLISVLEAASLSASSSVVIERP